MAMTHSLLQRAAAARGGAPVPRRAIPSWGDEGAEHG